MAVTATAVARTALTLVQAPAASRVDSVLAAEAAADSAMNPDGAEAEAQVAATAEARTVLTLLQAAAAAPSCGGSARNGCKGSSRRCNGCRWSRSAGTRDSNSRGKLCTYTHVATTAKASSVLTLVQAAAAAARCLDRRMTAKAAANEAAAAAAATGNRVDSVMAAKSAADNATNAGGIKVEAKATTTAEARTALTLVQPDMSPPRPATAGESTN